MLRWGAVALAGAAILFMSAGDALAGHFSSYLSIHSYGRHYRHRHFGRYRYRWRPRFSFRTCSVCGFPDYYYGHRVYYPAYAYEGYAYSGSRHEAVGAILGGIGGAVVGAQIGGGSGRAVATVLGSLAGILIGEDIGRPQDARDWILMARTTQYALEKARSGTEVEWRDPDSGKRGAVIPSPAYRNARGQYCREYQQTVMIGGRKEAAYGTACRQPDGSWKVVN